MHRNRLLVKPPRLFVPDLDPLSGEIILDGDKRHYVRDVLRMTQGDDLVLFDDSAWEYTATVCTATATGVRIKITGKRAGMTEPPVRLLLGVGLLKSHKMDLVIQKCVELGVHGILPIAANRAIAVPNTLRQARERQQRWEMIAQEASRQCGRCRIATIYPIATFDEVAGDADAADIRIIFSAREGRGVHHLPENPLHFAFPRILFLTGPEGGFTPEEERTAIEAGFIPVGLGPRTLRAETAAIMATGLLQYRFGDMGERLPQPAR